ncbi:MAG: hypothetical protein ACJ71O_00145 [Nitrososphaeraceae archaeon]|jgi:hypothetical protein
MIITIIPITIMPKLKLIPPLTLKRLLILLRFRYMLDVQINRYRIDMQKSNTHVDKDRLMIKIQTLEWVQGQVQDIILNNVTRDWPVYDSK